MTAPMYRKGDEVEVTRRGVIVEVDPTDPARFGIGRPGSHGAVAYFRTDDDTVRHRLVSDKTVPATALESAVALLRKHVGDARDAMATNPYWEGATFKQGIDNACGGGAGRLAALLSPEVADLLAGLLEELERQQNMPPCSDPSGVCNHCEWRPDFVVADALASALKEAGRG